jgi:hypothetical protein
MSHRHSPSTDPARRTSSVIPPVRSFKTTALATALSPRIRSFDSETPPVPHEAWHVEQQRGRVPASVQA